MTYYKFEYSISPVLFHVTCGMKKRAAATKWSGRGQCIVWWPMMSTERNQRWLVVTETVVPLSHSYSMPSTYFYRSNLLSVFSWLKPQSIKNTTEC